MSIEIRQVHTAVVDAQMVQLRTKAKRPRKQATNYSKSILTGKGEEGQVKETGKETKKETVYSCAILKETREGSGDGDERAESAGIFQAVPSTTWAV